MPYRSRQEFGGGERDRTDDPLLAKQVLSQLSYTPYMLVGLGGFEPPTPRLSSVCSNQLSYRPSDTSSKNNLLWILTDRQSFVKEVIQPQVPLRLPCYDFTPVMNLTVASALLTVRLPASGETHSHGVTGGVYKTRERIHRDMLIRDY